jgi:hypothetical protein
VGDDENNELSSSFYEEGGAPTGRPDLQGHDQVSFILLWA